MSSIPPYTVKCGAVQGAVQCAVLACCSGCSESFLALGSVRVLSMVLSMISQVLSRVVLSKVLCRVPRIMFVNGWCQICPGCPPGSTPKCCPGCAGSFLTLGSVSPRRCPGGSVEGCCPGCSKSCFALGGARSRLPLVGVALVIGRCQGAVESALQGGVQIVFAIVWRQNRPCCQPKNKLSEVPRIMFAIVCVRVLFA